MKKLPLFAVLLCLFAYGCGSPQLADTTQIDPKVQEIKDKTKEIIDGGLKVDLQSIIKRTWSVYYITLSSQGFYVIPNGMRKVKFDDNIIIVGGPQYFDPKKDMFAGYPFISFSYKSDSIESQRTDCAEVKADFKTTTVPDGTPIYGNEKEIYNVLVTYQVVKNGDVTKLKLTATGNTFLFCCDYPKGKCDGKDYTSQPYEKSWFFLVKGTESKGFVLQGYKDAAGVELDDYFLAFVEE